MAIDYDGNLYGWGYNNCGQLGVGDLINKTTPQKINLPNNEKTIDVFLSGYHSMVVTSEGNIYVWGKK